MSVTFGLIVLGMILGGVVVAVPSLIIGFIIGKFRERKKTQP